MQKDLVNLHHLVDKNIEKKDNRKMELRTKPFGFRRNWDYMKANLYIMYKSVLEYKTNLWSGFIIQIIFLLLSYLYFFILADNFGDVIGWNIMDFILYITLLDFFWMIPGPFIWSISLFYQISQGYLNPHLNKPIKPFISYLFSDLDHVAIIMLIITLPIAAGLLIIEGIALINILVATGVGLCIAAFHLSTHSFLESFNFRYLGIGRVFLPIFYEGNIYIDKYPFQFFEKSKIKFFLFMFGNIFVGSLVIPILKGYGIWRLDIQLYLLFGIIITATVGTILNWHYGLKKYEAFG